MGIQTRGSQGEGANSGKQSQFQTKLRLHSHSRNLGKQLSSMNLDELLKNVSTAEANQLLSVDIEDKTVTTQTDLHRQEGSISLTAAPSKRTVDEVWQDIQQSKSNDIKKFRDRQPTLGEMILEDFLVKAGVVAGVLRDKKVVGSVVDRIKWPYQEVDPNVGPQFFHQDNQMTLPSPLMGALSDTQRPGRKRGLPEDIIVKTVERRQKRMVKNRESVARSRARKQAYTNELENKVSRLEEEDERLRKIKEVEKMVGSAPIPDPKCQLRRMPSAPF